MGIFMRIQVPVRARAVRSPGSEVQEVCELPDVGARTELSSLEKQPSVLNHQAISLAP